VSLNSNKLTNLTDPTNAQDAATKAYVDAARSGLDVKASVRATTTANITLSGTQTIDGVVLIAGDRVLVKDQSTGSQNGIYVVVSGGAWTRATDADTSTEVTPGMFTFVEEGTVNADSGWVLSTNSTITLGTTSLAFAQFSGAGQITAGDGLTKTGNQFDVVTASATRIVVSADSIDLATTGVSASTYKSVTVDTYGRVTAGTNPTTLSGYGITDALSPSSDIDGGSYP
jgi:phage-related tail fiber protein